MLSEPFWRGHSSTIEIDSQSFYKDQFYILTDIEFTDIIV